MKKGIFKEQFSNSNERIKELDYLKCVFILLMIIFHLVYIGDKYPYAKQIVYTFHMSAFLIISGYLANIRKKAMPFSEQCSGFSYHTHSWKLDMLLCPPFFRFAKKVAEVITSSTFV